MHWILQDNLFSEREWTTLVAVLDRFALPYSVHKVIPFIGELTPPAQPTKPKVICIGSYSMRHSAKAFGWTPGVYDLEPFNFLVQKRMWKREMLNHDAHVCRFEDAVIEGPTFIRPIDDSKHFAGKVFDVEEFFTWKRNVCVLEHDYGSSLSKDTLIQLCKPKEIFSEYRFWVVNGRIATASLYKRGSRVVYSSDVDDRFFHYVSRLTFDWQPHKAFVVDVCDTPDGLKVVEINTLNSAGFYAGDMQKLVSALEDAES